MIKQYLYEDMALDTSVLGHAGIEEHLIEMVKLSYGNAWTAVQGIEEVLATGRGTNPGDPWANIMFIAIYAKVLKSHSRLEAANLLDFAPNMSSLFSSCSVDQDDFHVDARLFLPCL